MLGTLYLVWYLVLGMVRGTWCSIVGTWFGTWYMVLALGIALSPWDASLACFAALDRNLGYLVNLCILRN